MTINYVEWIGYIAMALLMFSFIQKNLTTLRVWNSLGCGVFIIYGVFLGAYPIIITNVFILCVNIYYLVFKKS